MDDREKAKIGEVINFSHACDVAKPNETELDRLNGVAELARQVTGCTGDYSYPDNVVDLK